MRPKRDKDKREKATVTRRGEVNKPKNKNKTQSKHISLLLEFTDRTRPTKVNGPGTTGCHSVLHLPIDKGWSPSEALFQIIPKHPPTQISSTFTKQGEGRTVGPVLTVIQLQQTERWERRTLLPSSQGRHGGERGLGVSSGKGTGWQDRRAGGRCRCWTPPY